MKSLQEKATSIVKKKNWTTNFSSGFCYGYIQGATEQQNIDIERACDIHCKLCELYGKCSQTAWGYENTCNEREEIKKYMKGE